MRLQGKVAIVIGGGGMKTIGRASALRLAKDGCDVVVSDIQRPPETVQEDERRVQWKGIQSVAAEIEQLGRRSQAIYCDITQVDQIEALVRETVAAFGHLDILVNSARAFTESLSLLEMDPEKWDRQMAVNVRGPLLCTKYAARQMVKQGNGGCIINMSSAVSKRASPGGGVYPTTKAALNMLTQVSALDLAQYGIRVNAVCPGVVFTNRYSPGDAQRAQTAGIPYDEYRQQWAEEKRKDVPLGRLAEPEDVADVVAFLASDDSRYMVGSLVDVNGGWMMPSP